jgi:pimeloyl-ACP methyl ester carboxylesterase
MKHVSAGVLDIAYLEVGPPDGMPIILLHGFPYDVHAYDDVARHLEVAGQRCIIPFLRGYGPTLFHIAETPRSGQQAALAADLLALLDALEIQKALLAGYDWGGRAACIVAALWPQRVHGLLSCGTGYNIQNIACANNPAPPEQERRLWYQFYFHAERGRAGLASNRHELCRLLWQLWSPNWNFSEAAYARSAAAFNNPDFVEVVIHSYRHRFGLVPGDPALDDIERQLAAQPAISVPTVVLHGEDDGVDPADVTDADAVRFCGPYARHILAGIGHNVPQEVPEAFAEAVLSLA